MSRGAPDPSVVVSGCGASPGPTNGPAHRPTDAIGGINHGARGNDDGRERPDQAGRQPMAGHRADHRGDRRDSRGRLARVERRTRAWHRQAGCRSVVRPVPQQRPRPGACGAVRRGRGRRCRPGPARPGPQYLNGILDRAHAAPYAGGRVTLSSERSLYLNAILDRAHATAYADAARRGDAYLNGILDRAHAAPYAVGAVRLPPIVGSSTFASRQQADQLLAVTTPQSPTSGTFHSRQGSRSAHGAGQAERRPGG